MVRLTPLVLECTQQQACRRRLQLIETYELFSSRDMVSRAAGMHAYTAQIFNHSGRKLARGHGIVNRTRETVNNTISPTGLSCVKLLEL